MAPASGQASLSAVFTPTGGFTRIPPSFLGLSIEYKELQDFEAEGPLFDRVISMIEPEDGTRMLLRIGGKSADHVYWQNAGANPPQWVSVFGTSWLTSLAALVRQENLRVMLDLNLAVHSPALETAFAEAANQALPAGSLSGLEIGNEPDLYWRQIQLEKQRIPTTRAPKNWAVNYSPADYRRDWISYARALKAKLPNVPLGGPDIISSKLPWLEAIQGLGRLDPGFITIHRYAASTCWPPDSPWYPKLSTMLAPGAAEGLAHTVESAVAFAHAHHEQLRLTEVNSISCGGNAGVANSFATALWAPDVLFSLIKAGVTSVSWHIRPFTLNAPFIAHPTSIAPQPELYGLAAFAQMTRPGGELLNGTLTASPALHLTVWAVRFHGGMRVLLINKGPIQANTTLKLGMSGHAYLKRLTAPHPSSTSNVTFGGQTIGTDARWQGNLRSPPVSGTDGSYGVSVPGYSAAMLTVWP